MLGTLLTLLLFVVALSFAEETRGIVCCGSDSMAANFMRIVWTVRRVWNSSLNTFSLAHCDELSTSSHAMIMDIGRLSNATIRFTNLCRNATFLAEELGMTLATAKRRLSGFYCKVAALLASPFQESLMIDLDVVFFKQPENLFSSPAYLRSGALYFRARTAFRTAQTRGRLIPSEALAFLHARGFNGTNSSFTDNGVNLFWRFGGQAPGSNELALSDIQDSSIVLFDKRSHSRTLKLLGQELASFDVGWGDKEIFWLSTTAAREGFEFSPFLAGQYGDCDGVMMHFDPEAEGEPEAALPFYINAEKLVEKDLNYVGDYLSGSLTNPVAARGGLVRDMRTWQRFRHEANCTCSATAYSCASVPALVADHLLLAEWLTMTIRHWVERKLADKATQSRPCVPVVVPYALQLLGALARLLPPRDCSFTGCSEPVSPELLLRLERAAGSRPAQHEEVCIGISFVEGGAPAAFNASERSASAAFSCAHKGVYGDGRSARKRAHHRVCYRADARAINRL